MQKALRQIGAPTQTRRWVESFIGGRTIHPTRGGVEGNPLNPEIGLPQGSPVSPVLFSILVGRVASKRANSVYAGDVMVLAHHRETEKAVEEMTKRADETAEQLENWGLKIESKKSEIIVFKEKKQDQVAEITVKVRGTEIRPNRTVRYLGVYLDHMLNFTQHVKTRMSSTQPMMSLLRRLGGTTS